MDFALTEELVMVRDAAREFSDKELVPRATGHDRREALDPEVLTLITELGLWGMTIPERYDGSEMGNLALALALEELNRGCAATGVTVSVHNSLVATPIVKFGSEEQKQAWLPRMATGEVLGAYALSEAGSGSDAAALRTSARRDGDGWVLSGTKMWVTSGDGAGVVIVYARTNPDEPRARGVSAFLVPADSAGFRVGKHEKKTGIRGSSTTEIVLDDVRLGPEALLGELDRGFPIAMDTLDGGRIGIGAQAVGIGRACLEASIKYAREREQFGKPIGRFQAVQWKLADMSTRLDASRLLVHRAAWLRDRGERCSAESAKAKLFASRTANYCADECVQIHGGAGYTDDFHVERLFRDARITEIYEGATDIQRIVIARSLLQ